MSSVKFIESFKAARRVAIPLIAVQTPDPASTIRKLAAVSKTDPLIRWDIVTGMSGLNEAGKNAIEKVLGEQDPSMLNNPTEALSFAAKFPNNSILFFMNGDRFINERGAAGASVCQALWNLRDIYKTNERAVVILCPSISLPENLTQDVLVLDEPLPDSTELKTIITDIHKFGNVTEPKPEVLTKAIEAVKGLSAFTAEQVTAMSLKKDGLDLNELWERKRKTVEQTPGLQVWRGGETFKDVRGVANVKNFLGKLFKGNSPPTTIVFMDEIEKQFGSVAAGGDTSGVSQEMFGEFLSWMQDKNVLGMMAVGHPGCSKSHVTKATGGEFNVPTVVLNMSALKASLVGQSGQQLRGALKVIEAIGRPMVMATSNSLASLPPELRRRFQLGTFFFDLPTEDERQAVWDLYLKKFGLSLFNKEDNGNTPDDEGWTPAEIRTCCEIAWRLNCSLNEATNYIVPISRSAPDRIEALRNQANGKFLSASEKGVYRYSKAAVSQSEGRKIRVAE